MSLSQKKKLKTAAAKDCTFHRLGDQRVTLVFHVSGLGEETNCGQNGQVKVGELGTCGQLSGPYEKCNQKLMQQKGPQRTLCSLSIVLHPSLRWLQLFIQVLIIILLRRQYSKGYSSRTWFLSSQVRIHFECPLRGLGV